MAKTAPDVDEKLAEALAEFDRSEASAREQSEEKGAAAPAQRSPVRSLKELSEAERAREQLWVESVRRYNLRLTVDRRLAWAEHHRQQAARLRHTLENLIAHHEAQAAQLEAD